MTWPSHQRLERRIDVKARFATLDAYRAHLERMWGFCAALEQQIPVDAFATALPDYATRRKLALLEADLADLGISRLACEALPTCPALPTIPSVGAAFGCVYVFEGATLGGQTLLPLVERRLGLVAGRGTRFLASYGADVALMWRRFGAALDAWCCDESRRRDAEDAAIGTFAALEDWLCTVPR